MCLFSFMELSLFVFRIKTVIFILLENHTSKCTTFEKIRGTNGTCQKWLIRATFQGFAKKSVPFLKLKWYTIFRCITAKIVNCTIVP